MEYHGVDVARTPWQLISTLDKVGQLPVGTRVPFAIWHNYLIVLLHYLHGLMSNEHKHYALDHEPTLTKEDAADFVHVHFPDEGRLLKQPNYTGLRPLHAVGNTRQRFMHGAR